MAANEAVDDDVDYEERDCCGRCGGEGFIQLSEAPELWGDDCFMEKDRPVTFPDCRGTGLE
jgi:hypothetical protein